jgi:hypothetical protein
MRYREWEQLVTMTVEPRNYLEGPWGARQFCYDAQATDFLRKSPLVPTGIDRKRVAMDTFFVCEKQCHQTNLFLRLLRYPSTSESPAEGRYREILRRARKIASRILGRVPDDLDGSFGPGTSFELKGQAYNTLADKMWVTPHTTLECAPVFEHMFWRTLWGRTRLEQCLPLPGICRGNRFTTVPKDAKTDRGICVEPLGNLFVQLGIGGYLKRRLSNVGLHVARNTAGSDPIQRWRTAPRPDGQVVHRNMARDGSLTGQWSTIDLSNASDTVALELVRDVLPPDWFELLSSCRSPMTQINKTWVLLDKFSSMGNGFTFELETLLFACLIAAATGLTVGSDLFVYGDDIILPTAHSRDALAVLEISGFTPNQRKSFTSGPFRESCGGDYFSGFSVRSYYAKGEFSSPLEWIACHNALLHKFGYVTRTAMERCVRAIPVNLRSFGPSWLGDLVLHGPDRRFKTWTEGGMRFVKTVIPIPSKIPLDRWGECFTLSLAVLGVSSEGITPRGAIEGWRLHKSSVS